MNQHSITIENWLMGNLKDKGYERFDDIHIDQIDQGWQSRNSWIEGGLEAFQTALDLRDRRGLELVVVLAYSLKGNKEPRGIDFQTPEELKAQLNWSPPSLYLFKRGEEPWTETGIINGKIVAKNVVVRDVNTSVFGNPIRAKRCYYMEFRQIEFNEYSRTLFVEG